jgi:hypothetical protein
MLVLAQAREELVLAPAPDRAWEAADLASARGWAERPVRPRLVQVPVS